MKKFLPIVVLIFCLTACAPLYMPNGENVPSMKSKGETHIGVTAGIPALQLTGAHSITNHLYVMANGSGTLLISRSVFGETGIGYFHSIGKKFIWNCAAGAGLGSAQSEYTDNNFAFVGNKTYYRGNFSRYFIQPSIGFINEDFEAGLSFRNSFVRFSEYYGGTKTSSVNYKYSGVMGCFSEPAIYMRLGGELVKFSLQSGVSLRVHRGNFNHEFYFPLFISAGINIKLGGSEK